MARDTHERMIKAAAGLLERKGFHGTALNDVLASSGAPRGSLYFHFPDGKAQLALEATQQAIETLTAARTLAFASADSPATAVRIIARDIADAVEATDYQGGCPISPLVLDGDAMGAEIADLCRDTFSRWTDGIQNALEAAGIATSDARGLALLTLSTFQGALILSRAARDVEPLLAAADQLASVIERATGPDS